MEVDWILKKADAYKQTLLEICSLWLGEQGQVQEEVNTLQFYVKADTCILLALYNRVDCC